MFLLFETVLLKRGKPVNLPFHQRRVDESRLHFWGLDSINLEQYVPNSDESSDYRCRIDYNEEIVSVVTTPAVTQKVRSLQVVISDETEYTYKYSDRTALDRLYSQRKLSDDILIVKNGRITDTSNANIIFSTGEKYITPSFPLLRGTQRASLLENGVILEEDIKIEDISKFKYWQCINALNPFNESCFNPLSMISF